MALFYPILMILMIRLLCLLINLSLASASSDVHFSYNSTSGWENIDIAGGTSINGSILELTSASSTSNCSWATYNKPITLVDNDTGMPTSFETNFTFFINATGDNRGDGLTFFLSPYPPPESANTCGGDLGLFSSDNNIDSTSQNQVVAVEFDTYSDDWDPKFYHVGIDVNSIYSVLVHQIPDNMIQSASGTRATTWVSYSANDQTLNVSLSYQQDSKAPGNPILSYKVNLTQVLPKIVAVGFSAATGAATEIHQILLGSFQPPLDPVQAHQRQNISH